MIEATDIGAFSSLTLLTIIVALSYVFRHQKKTNKEIDLAIYSRKLFTEGDFPMVIVNRDLDVCFVNDKFHNLFFLNTSNKSFDALMLREPFVKKPELLELFRNFQNTGDFPDKAVFLSLSLTIVNGETEIFPKCYFLVRKVTGDGANISPVLVLAIIDSSFTGAMTTELVQRIAQKDGNLKKLEEIDQLKSEFLATLSHELKTPLVSIRGYLDLMASEKFGPLTEKQEKALRISLKNTSHLNNLISSILNFARMEAGKLRFDLVHQKLPQHINDIIDSLRLIADSRNIAFVKDFDDNLPSVIFDPELLHRVLSNLLENSIKFSQPGTQICIGARQFNEYLVKVTIKDQGCGIAADKLDKIKAPFYQADKSDTRPTGGLGLGLAIAEKILIGHGTTLSIESEEGKGTTCSFMLKVVPIG